MEPDDSPKNKGGRPTKYTQYMRDKIMALSGAGNTDEQISEQLNISRSTLSLWKNVHGFSDILKECKEVADDMVEMSLLDNAINNQNVTAQIFWLKNRRPSEWRDKVELGIEDIDEMEF